MWSNLYFTTVLNGNFSHKKGKTIVLVGKEVTEKKSLPHLKLIKLWLFEHGLHMLLNSKLQNRIIWQISCTKAMQKNLSEITLKEKFETNVLITSNV